MPAPEKSSLKNEIKTLGVIAGGGDVPARLVESCDEAGIDVFIVAFEGQTDPALVKGRHYMMTRLGAAGKIIDTLRTHNIKDLVLIGSIRRPGLSELMPDMRTAQFFTRIGLRAVGDDNLLKAVRDELEKEGFAIHGVQEFVANLLAKEGPVGRYEPKKADWPDIERGLEAALEIGRLDIGQSVIIQDGIILGVEAAEGTDELIRRCAPSQRKGRGAILVKACKPQQDHDFDLPTIGPETVRLCAESGFAGIVIQAGCGILLSPREVAGLADKNKMFVFALDPEKQYHAA